jgi:hypothetical protein
LSVQKLSTFILLIFQYKNEGSGDHYRAPGGHFGAPGGHLELQVAIVELYEAIVSSRRSFWVSRGSKPWFCLYFQWKWRF